MADLIWEDTHRAFVSCFHAFYPSGYLKWACVCSMLSAVEASPSSASDSMAAAGGSVQLANHDRLLTAVLDALCNPLIRLRNTFPIIYSPDGDTPGGRPGGGGGGSGCGKLTVSALSPTENLASITASMLQAGETCVQRFPILTELMNFRVHQDGGAKYSAWTFRDVLDRLLVIASQPVKQALKGEPVSFSRSLVEKAAQVISSVISELANQTLTCETEMHSLGGRILQMTPNRSVT